MVSPSLQLLRTQSDERLTDLARQGHERAFEALVERHRRPLLRHARRLLPEAHAEEAVQQALLAAWAALRRGDDVRHVGGWLHRIVHNAALNALRGERDDRAELREWLAAAGAPEDELERRRLLRETLANLAALPERQREALLRVAVDGDSAEQVGGQLGLSVGAVRQLLYRARTALRAAATALTPPQVASWLASVSTRSEPLGDRISELVGGAGAAGLGATLAKTGMVVAVAGTAAAGPALVADGPGRHAAPRPPTDGLVRVDDARSPRLIGGGGGLHDRAEGSRSGRSGSTSGSSGPGSGSGSRSGSSGPGSGSTSGPSGPGSGSTSGSSGPGSGTSDSSSGSSGPGSGTSTSGTSGSASGSGSSASTSGSSGPGSGTSASLTSGSTTTSGPSGSGTGESGSSGSDSGTSGSGSGDSGSGSG